MDRPTDRLDVGVKRWMRDHRCGLLGDAADLDRNIRKLLIAAGLSPDEREEFARLFRQHVDDHRPAESQPDYAELLH